MANRRAQELLRGEVPSPLSRAKMREIDRIVEEAEAKAPESSREGVRDSGGHTVGAR